MKTFYTPFSPTIYYNDEVKVSNHEAIKDWILNMYDQSPVKDGNFYHTGFTTYFYDDFSGHLDSQDMFTELRDMILVEADIYVRHGLSVLAANGTSVGGPKALRFTNMWFNVNPPGGYQGRHHHAMNLLGGTYYIDVPPNSGKIGFYNPNAFAYLHNQEPPAKNLLIPNFDVITRAGDLLLWPGWMDHEISVNKTVDQNRITVSFGINWV
jgi:uncharacterized protein (TIGR02466 family)